jgi:hypothetical protein
MAGDRDHQLGTHSLHHGLQLGADESAEPHRQVRAATVFAEPQDGGQLAAE